MNFKKIMSLLLITGIFSTNANAEIFADANGKTNIRSIRNALRYKGIDPAKTCVDEFLDRSRNLGIKTGLGLPVGAPLTVGGFYAGAYTGAAAGMAAGAGFGVIATAALGAIFGGAAIGIGALTYTSVVGIKLGLNNYLLKVVAESHDKGGKHLERFVRKFNNKFKSELNYQKRGLLEIAHIIQKADRDGSLCNGNITGKYSTLKKRLVTKKHLENYLIQSL
jgi:hypothetical protein